MTTKVFISYSHDSPEHEDLVLTLADRLRSDGIDAQVDQYESAPSEGWVRWMRKNIKDADFVLSICTETYQRRAEGSEEPGKGRGGDREGLIIDQEVYDYNGKNKKFIALILRESDREFVPEFLRPYPIYSTETDPGYYKLYRRLTDQPEVVKPVIGTLRSLPPRHRKSLSNRGTVMATDATTFEPLAIDLQVDPPSGDTELDFTLERICDNDGTIRWKLDFELKEKDNTGTLKPVMKLRIDVRGEDNDKAAATAKHGLDENQRAQADVTAQTANSVRTGDATSDDVLVQGSQVIPARDPGSPS